MDYSSFERPPRTSDLTFYVAFNCDTSSHLSPLSDGYGGWGITANNAYGSITQVLPKERVGAVDYQTIPIHEWEHGYVFDDAPEDTTVDIASFYGMLNHEDAQSFIQSLYPTGDLTDTLGILSADGSFPALSLEVESPSSVVSLYVCALYKGEPCKSASARRAIKWVIDGDRFPHADPVNLDSTSI